MTPSQYITPQIIDLCKQHRSIVIIGGPCSGKTSIAKYISEQISYQYVSTDDYQNDVDLLLYNVSKYNNPLIIEGMLAYRLLRKGAQTQSFNPELIIKLECNFETIKHLYKKYRDPSKLNYVNGMINGSNKIWNEYIDYLAYHFIKKPTYIEINTSLSYL